METLHCTVYRGGRDADTYLYVAQVDDCTRVPEALLDQLGALVHVMDLELHPGRRLARAEPLTVMRALREEGFYLQLPPRDSLALSG
jgi:hypothetical protein